MRFVLIMIHLQAHLQQKTKEWPELAETPGYENLHSKICVGDLKSNEVFYHNKCWVRLKRDSEAYKKGTSQNEFDAILKFKQDYCMRNVYQYVYETLYENPLTHVELRAIFERYKSNCETNHVLLIQILLVSETLLKCSCLMILKS